MGKYKAQLVSRGFAHGVGYFIALFHHYQLTFEVSEQAAVRLN